MGRPDTIDAQIKSVPDPNVAAMEAVHGSSDAAQLPPSTTSTNAKSPQDEEHDYPADLVDQTPNQVWISKGKEKYTSLLSSLPAKVSSHMPTPDTAESAASFTASKVASLASSASELGRSGSVKMGEQLKRTGSGMGDRGKGVGKSLQQTWKEKGPDRFLTNAWSVTNETQIALNISLNQVGPLMYSVVLPNETFARRVPNVWYALEVRPYTLPKSAYSSWSVTWPILAVSGPIVAATSLLAIPFIALAAGGTALASLTAFGEAASAGAASTAASAAAFATKANYLPGAARVKGRLVDAAKKNFFGGKDPKEHVQSEVVKYIGRAVTGAAFSGAAVGGTGAGGEGHIEGQRRKGKEVMKEKSDHKDKKKVELDVTGYDLEKVLKCETGKNKLDKQLAEAFEDLNIKVWKQLKTADNPVLRVVGGPEIEERGEKQYLVFHALRLELVPDIVVEPLSSAEAPPTTEETAFLRDLRVVDTVEIAEQVTKQSPVYGEGEEYRKEKAESVDKAVQEAEEFEVIESEGVKEEKRKDDETVQQPEKKGWFGGWGGSK